MKTRKTRIERDEKVKGRKEERERDRITQTRTMKEKDKYKIERRNRKAKIASQKPQTRHEAIRRQVFMTYLWLHC